MIDHRDSPARRGVWIKINNRWTYTADINRINNFAYGQATGAPITIHNLPQYIITTNVDVTDV